ncbi:MAG TPA: DUF177 domain-containing protein [Rhizomicrobium sp.]|nr:DUF177 domain-containing protein [Rhizomicrobium sp.]
MSDQPPPIERLYDLNRLSEAGYETTVAPGAEDLAKIARWADVVAVNRFEGQISLRRLSSTRFSYAAHLEADIVQSCTVTLEPVSASLSLEFTRALHLVPHVKKTVDFSGELSPAAADDDVPDEIDSTRYDLAAPLLEEFSLAIDPYPRAPGVAFDAPEAANDRPENPFAVLGKLKEKRQ